MRLKSLDVVGFKSFLEPTVITFSPGITAVVGPNGCGKSNVVDAIRWVLGEQAPTRLRGKSVEDLIFAGNDSNSAAGMAEVTLMLETEEQRPLPEPYAALSEVAVTRRVYRSGESEYLINRIPCRLKDISEFFLSAQIHSRGYALVEQGRIDEIIQAKPNELRTMVEEAAGLALFRGRREISERKLERTRENLARVADVLGEIERQLNYARRQAKKAETYKTVRSELDELEQIVAARRLLQQKTELATHSTRAAELQSHNEALRLAVEAAQREADETSAALAAARDQLATIERELGNLRSSSEERARNRGFLERRLADLNKLAPSLDDRLTDLASQITMARAARAVAGARLAREKNRSDSVNESNLNDLRGRHRAAEAAARGGERRLEEVKDELAEIMREAAVTRGRLGDLAGQRAEEEARLSELEREMPTLASAVASGKEAVVLAEQTCHDAADQLARCEAAQRDSETRLLQLRAAIEQSALKLVTLRQACNEAALRARPMLPGSAGDRLRAVLQSLNGDRPPTPPAMLLEIIKAPPALEPALRAVLGEQLDAVITDSPEFALRAIDLLKQKQTGRLSFIPPNLAAGEVHEAIDSPGVSGRLLDLVDVERPFQQLAEALIGHVMLVRDLPSAYAAAGLNGVGTVFVTPEGDLLAPDRMISGGSGAHTDRNESLSMRERAAALDKATQALAEGDADHEGLLRLYDWARLASADEVNASRRARAAVNAADAALVQVRANLAKIEQRVSLSDGRRSSAQRRVEELARQVTTSNQRLEELALAEQAKRVALAEVANELAALRANSRQLAESVQHISSQIESHKTAVAALQQEFRHQRTIAETLDGQSLRAREELDRAVADRAEFSSELDSLCTQEEAAQARAADLEAALVEAQRCHNDCAEAADKARRALKSNQQQLTSIDEAVTACGLQCERARALCEELDRSFEEKFGTAFALMRDELETRLSDRDPQADSNRLSELRTKIEKIGEVNLAAESEVAELEQRAQQLTRERDDLQAAADDLSQTIQKLNREARKRFAETFEGAARNFTELFPKLMRGGKGRLELAEAGDLLEAGVNIFVQPVGKKVKELGLLSGGEKALSAMALIFSLFLLNPSPFCVMDEVDAPLDEFSLAAFTGLVRELKSASQFIVITHNQRTMQAADQIHGVTMEKPGISRIISMEIPRAA